MANRNTVAKRKRNIKPPDFTTLDCVIEPRVRGCYMKRIAFLNHAGGTVTATQYVAKQRAEVSSFLVPLPNR